MGLEHAGPDDIERVLRLTHTRRATGLHLEQEIALDRLLRGRPRGGGRRLDPPRRDWVFRDAGGEIAALVSLTPSRATLDGRERHLGRLSVLAVPVESGARRAVAGDLWNEAIDQAREMHYELVLAIRPRDDGPAGPAPPARLAALPCNEAACRTTMPVPWVKEPAWLRSGGPPAGHVQGLRPGGLADLVAMAEIHALETAGQRLRIDRGRADWERMFAARAWLARERGAEDPFWVIERGGRVDAYVLLEPGRQTVRWREHGARPGAEPLLEDLFWTALGWARQAGARRVEGWCMPPVLTERALWPTSDRARAHDVVLLCVAEEGQAPPQFAREHECRIPELDVTDLGAPLCGLSE